MPAFPPGARRLVLTTALALAATASAAQDSPPPTPRPVPPPHTAQDAPIGALRIAATPLPVPAFDAAAVQSEVRAVLEAQVREWNAGSVRGFMGGYAEVDSLVFLSGTSVRRGWEEALYAYLRTYPNAAAMGLLSFDEVTVTPLSGVHAVAWGRWRLRVDGPAGEQPGGLFTLILVKTDQGWRIVHDHTS